MRNDIEPPTSLEDIANELRKRLNRVIGENLALEHRIAVLEAAGREMRSLQRERDAERACESPNDQAEVLAETLEERFDALLAEADAGKPSDSEEPSDA